MKVSENRCPECNMTEGRHEEWCSIGRNWSVMKKRVAGMGNAKSEQFQTVSDVALEMRTAVMLSKQLGTPVADHQLVSDWANQLFRLEANTPAVSKERLEEIAEKWSVKFMRDWYHDGRKQWLVPFMMDAIREALSLK